MDDGCFAPRAARLAGLAALLLGWRPAEFWAATPAELGCVFGAMDAHGETAPAVKGPDLARLKEMFPDG